MIKNKFMKRTAIVITTLLMALQLNFPGTLSNNAQRLRNYGTVEAVAYAAGVDYTWNNTIPQKTPLPANVSLNEAVITYDGIKNADVFVMAEANRTMGNSNV